ncbi:hypothetical protein THAOC_25091 [Thalassiosira oceanica]|uniref:Uncharacterized protein n=1 Tax=Thalassiosira oceanica TaxID=159749 RepID=K0RQ82_THAOC|nr:hypothetical protein THAOC_25091 [Thalassiosira oceanica]|eukprot:EJK55200.1 hypothetical protein THAOC_25091 [Thalassiosira oceanica]
MEVAEGCNPDQNRPPFTILASTEAVDPGIADDFGLEKYEATKYRRSGNTGFKKRQFSNGDLRPAESQVNYKYVQMDVGTLTGDLSPNIHRSTTIASIIRFACFCLLSNHSLFNRVLPEGLLQQGLSPAAPRKNGQQTPMVESCFTHRWKVFIYLGPTLEVDTATSFDPIVSRPEVSRSDQRTAGEASDPSLDPLRSSGDTGSVWIGSSVEEQGPPAPRLASAAGGTPITAPHVPAPPRRGSERCGARDSSKDHRRSIGAAGSATIGTSGEIKIQPRRPS